MVTPLDRRDECEDGDASTGGAGRVPRGLTPRRFNVQTARVDGHGGLIAVSPEYTAVTASGAGFHSLTTEVHDHYPTVEGTIPEWLSGTLVRNGPARFEAGDRRVNHWFDGLAMLRRYAFTDGRLRYSNRFLRTDAYEEAMDGRLTGQFGTDTRGWRRLLEMVASLGVPEPTDNANVHVACIDGEYVALTEAPRRVAFDPETLETRGHFRFHDDLSEHITAAHLVDDPHQDELVGFTTQFGRTPQYHLYRLHRRVGRGRSSPPSTRTGRRTSTTAASPRTTSSSWSRHLSSRYSGH